MNRVAITQAAFDAMPLGTMGYEPETNARASATISRLPRSDSLPALSAATNSPPAQI
jgi:hypothetical protein